MNDERRAYDLRPQHDDHQPPPDMVKTVGGTTFDIYFHFSQTSRETFTDKVLRLIQSDVVTS